jgi:hypothetical protein
MFMVQLYSLMWILAIFFGVAGYMRGWNREVVALAGTALGMFVLFQFDALIRGTLLLSFTRNQAFFLQVSTFLIIVLWLTAIGVLCRSGGRAKPPQTGILGAIVGLVNGYLIGGTLWYFLDINEYPLAPYVLAPAPTSPSAQSLGSIPLVILSGGVGGAGDLLIVGIVVLFLIVLMVL